MNAELTPNPENQKQENALPKQQPPKKPVLKVSYKQSGVRTVRMIGYVIIAFNLMLALLVLSSGTPFSISIVIISVPFVLAAAGICFAAATIAEAALFVKAKIERDNRIDSN